LLTTDDGQIESGVVVVVVVVAVAVAVAVAVVVVVVVVVVVAGSIVLVLVGVPVQKFENLYGGSIPKIRHIIDTGIPCQ